MRLNVYDMDGTIVDSTAAIRQCQIEGLQRATGKDLSNLEKMLKENGLKGALQQLNINQDAFFNVHYKTFDPYDSVRNGKMNVFEDMMQSIKQSPYACLISNSIVDATQRKLDASGLGGHFKHIFAEVEKSKAKPQPYMANQLVNAMKDKGTLGGVEDLVNVGDMPVDMEFGMVLHDVLSSALGKNVPFRNYLIDRGCKYETAPKGSEILRPRSGIYEF